MLFANRQLLNIGNIGIAGGCQSSASNATEAPRSSASCSRPRSRSCISSVRRGSLCTACYVSPGHCALNDKHKFCTFCFACPLLHDSGIHASQQMVRSWCASCRTDGNSGKSSKAGSLESTLSFVSCMFAVSTQHALHVTSSFVIRAVQDCQEQQLLLIGRSLMSWAAASLKSILVWQDCLLTYIAFTYVLFTHMNPQSTGP